VLEGFEEGRFDEFVVSLVNEEDVRLVGQQLVGHNVHAVECVGAAACVDCFHLPLRM